MNDLQAKFAVTLVAVGFILSYAVPAMKEMKQRHDIVIQQVGSPYAAPSQNASTASDDSNPDSQR
jgi:hypothetical protein